MNAFSKRGSALGNSLAIIGRGIYNMFHVSYINKCYIYMMMIRIKLMIMISNDYDERYDGSDDAYVFFYSFRAHTYRLYTR